MYNIYWLTNDLRVEDNAALMQACENSSELCVVYIFPKDFFSLGVYRRNFLLESLGALEASLNKKKLELYVASSCDEIPVNNDINCVFYTKSYNYKQKNIENKIKNKYRVYPVEQNLLFDEYPFSLNETPKTFTKYRKLIEKSERRTHQNREVKFWPKNKDMNLKTFSAWRVGNEIESMNAQFIGGESSGRQRLDYYLWESRHVDSYKLTRNGMINFDDSSKLSPWLSLGCISARRIDSELQKYESKICSNESTYWLYFEILWRDYFKLLSVSQDKQLFEISGAQKKQLSFSSSQDSLFKDWCNGETENDFVNANMKELSSSGWMSNRGRQNVASYLAKTLNVDWTWGAGWFEKHLIDYDVESNWGNWAYLAGVSVDPRDRKFNVERQASMYDADRSYRNKFL